MRGGHKTARNYLSQIKLEALGQCIPPPRHVLPVSRYGSGSVTVSGLMIRIAKKFDHLFISPLLTLRENFMQICSEVFAKLLTDRQTDRQTEQTNNDVYISSLAEVMMRTNTQHKVHIAATKLPQPLSQNTNNFGEATAQSRCRTLRRSKVNGKILIVGNRGREARAPVSNSWRRQWRQTIPYQ